MPQETGIIEFTKLHGCGNDYIVIEDLQSEHNNTTVNIQKMCDRHRGIGADGVILIRPCVEATCEMIIYNADGSSAEMCGNGMRCVAKYIYDRGMVSHNILKIKSGSSIHETTVQTDEHGKACSAVIQMGIPVFGNLEHEVLRIGRLNFNFVRVSVGNPHAIFFVRDFEDYPLEVYGPEIEHHPVFPNRTNVEFVKVLDRDRIAMRVWERGSGETYACGSGSCAAVAVCERAKLTNSDVSVTLLGGTLQVKVSQEDKSLLLSGPMEECMQGRYILE